MNIKKQYMNEKIKLYYRLKYLRYCLPEPKKTMNEYPTVIQMPITYVCNFDCVMCGMHHLASQPHFSPSEIGEILEDKLFQKVEGVGVNGGEPFLRNDIEECIQVIIDKLPQLKQFYFISNGYFTDKILSKLKIIKQICDKKDIKVNLSISVDGVEDMQDFMRGRKNAWENAIRTLEEIKKEQNQYCDYLNVICTITKYNIYRIAEVENWASEFAIDVAYNVATENVRIDNIDRVEDFTIYNDEEARRLTMEFFYKKAKKDNSLRYFAIYLFIKDNKRYSQCDCALKNWVTLTPDCQIGYCATHSKNLGDAKKESAYQLFHDNTDYLNELKQNQCDRCSHYIYGLNFEGMRLFYKEQLRDWI